MAKYSYEIKTPEGTFDVESDTELTPAQAYKYASRGSKGATPTTPTPTASAASTAPSKPSQTAPAVSPTGPGGEFDPAADMNFAEKALVGIGGGMRRTYLGAKDLVGLGTPEEEQELKDWEKSKENLGNWGKAGEIGGELAATALPGGGVAAGTAKVLTKALPFLKSVGSVGGRVFNLGTAGRAATEGAVSAGIMKPGENETRFGNVVQGGTVGAALPLAGAGASGVRGAYRAVSTAPEQAVVRGAHALERTLGKDVVKQAEHKVATGLNQGSVLPKTTAALTEDARFGALERGARGAGRVDFNPHDQKVAAQAWRELNKHTGEADILPSLEGVPQELRDKLTGSLKRMPLSPDKSASIRSELEALSLTSEALADPTIRRQLNNAIRALGGANDAEVLARLRFQLDKNAGSEAIDSARSALNNAIDDITGGGMAKFTEETKEATKALAGARGAQDVRSQFMSEGGQPLTRETFPTSGGDRPVLRSHPLSQAIAKYGEEVMDPTAVENLTGLTRELRKHEIYKPTPATGGTTLKMGPEQAIGATAVNVSPLWRTRGIVGTVFSHTDEATRKAVDNAMLDPNKFLEMIAAKEARNRPLEGWEKKLKSVLMSTARAGGASAAGD